MSEIRERISEIGSCNSTTLSALEHLLVGPTLHNENGSLFLCFDDGVIGYKWLEVMSNLFLDDLEPKHHSLGTFPVPSSIYNLLLAVVHGTMRYNKRWQFNPSLTGAEKAELRRIKIRLRSVCDIG